MQSTPKKSVTGVSPPAFNRAEKLMREIGTSIWTSILILFIYDKKIVDFNIYCIKCVSWKLVFRFITTKRRTWKFSSTYFHWKHFFNFLLWFPRDKKIGKRTILNLVLVLSFSLYVCFSYLNMGIHSRIPLQLFLSQLFIFFTWRFRSTYFMFPL